MTNGNALFVDDLDATVGRDWGPVALIDRPADFVHIERASIHHRANQLEAALVELDAALAIYDCADTRARRAQVLLSLGRYQEGFADFQSRWVAFRKVAEPATRDMLMLSPRWRGEDLCGKRIVLVHEQGYGDTIQLLRFVPVLQAMGADVALFVPPPLRRLAAQLAPISETVHATEFVCPFFDLPMILGSTPASVPKPPYLRAGTFQHQRWRLGVAWSSAREKVPGDINREIGLGLLPLGGGNIVSLQKHDDELAREYGVETPVYADFSEIAAAAALCQTIIAVDTAAVHVAGAIGHPNVFALLPHVSSWRWRNGNPWYPQINLCVDGPAADWTEALIRLREAMHERPAQQMARTEGARPGGHQ